MGSYPHIHRLVHPLPGPYPLLPPPDLDKEGRVDNQRDTPPNTRLTVQPIRATSVFAWAALLAFVLCAVAYLIKRGYEVAQRRLNVPKTLHMTLWPPACSSSPRRWRTWT